jgi:hypothetical protein
VLSTTSPTTVTSIFVEGSGEDANHGNGNGSWPGRGAHHHGARGHGGRGVNSSRNGHARH